jgi:hypothetical protein
MTESRITGLMRIEQGVPRIGATRDTKRSHIE